MEDTDDLLGHALKHQQVPNMDSDADTVFEADAGIHNLIQYLYDKGIKTFNSCEDNFDGEDSLQIVWVQFSLDAWMGITAMASMEIQPSYSNS